MNSGTSSTHTKRYSLNGSNIPQPIAESTCLNGTSGSNYLHFQWGETPIAIGSHRNSSSCLENHCRNKVSSPQKQKINIRKIDPHIYTNIESKGLVHRIMQYHENGNSLKRSMSSSDLGYRNKFCVVQLKKLELPYRAAKQNLSMTRIPPPEKSMFQGNTLSSLLRSNSIINLQRGNHDISSENRPIIHPPVAENDLQPTRSVLDVLKEISRKRINSDDLIKNDTTKKYCSYAYPPSVTVPVISHKRQRETSSVYSNTSHLMPQMILQSCSPLDHTTNGNEIQSSPEQTAKKRMCNYNNDITSSLSSSLISNHKRKCNQEKDKSKEKLFFNGTLNSIKESMDIDEIKFYRQNEKVKNKTGLKVEKLMDESIYLSPSTSTLHRTPLDLNDTIPSQRSLSVCTSTAKKSNLTLFNTKCNDPSSSIQVNDSLFNYNGNGDSLGVQFVKPKKRLGNESLISNPIIQRTQKSKLALMLCGLRGELYHGNDDDNDNHFQKKGGVDVGLEQTKLETHLNSSSTVKPSTNIYETPVSPLPKLTLQSPLLGIKLSSSAADKRNVTKTAISTIPSFGSSTIINTSDKSTSSLIVNNSTYPQLLGFCFKSGNLLSSHTETFVSNVIHTSTTTSITRVSSPLKTSVTNQISSLSHDNTFRTNLISCSATTPSFNTTPLISTSTIPAPVIATLTSSPNILNTLQLSKLPIITTANVNSNTVQAPKFTFGVTDSLTGSKEILPITTSINVSCHSSIAATPSILKDAEPNFSTTAVSNLGSSVVDETNYLRKVVNTSQSTVPVENVKHVLISTTPPINTLLSSSNSVLKPDVLTSLHSFNTNTTFASSPHQGTSKSVLQSPISVDEFSFDISAKNSVLNNPLPFTSSTDITKSELESRKMLSSTAGTMFDMSANKVISSATLPFGDNVNKSQILILPQNKTIDKKPAFNFNNCTNSISTNIVNYNNKALFAGLAADNISNEPNPTNSFEKGCGQNTTYDAAKVFSFGTPDNKPTKNFNFGANSDDKSFFSDNKINVPSGEITIFGGNFGTSTVSRSNSNVSNTQIRAFKFGAQLNTSSTNSFVSSVDNIFGGIGVKPSVNSNSAETIPGLSFSSGVNAPQPGIFSSAVNNLQQNAEENVTNMFSQISSSTLNERPIRRATRRLHK